VILKFIFFILNLVKIQRNLTTNILLVLEFVLKQASSRFMELEYYLLESLLMIRFSFY